MSTSEQTFSRMQDSGLRAMPALTALPPRDASALVRMVRDRLRQAIMFGEIPTGTRLNQVHVAEQLGVSRMPVRTATAELVTEGLLEPIATGGVAVRPLNRDDVLNAYEVREALEAQAARDVAERQPKTAIDRLFAILDRHDELGGVNDVAALTELDREFHSAILEGTDNPFFARAMVPMWSIVERAMIGMLQTVPDMFNLAWQQHREIAEALRDAEPDLVEARVREHIAHAAESLSRAYAAARSDA